MVVIEQVEPFDPPMQNTIKICTHVKFAYVPIVHLTLMLINYMCGVLSLL